MHSLKLLSFFSSAGRRYVFPLFMEGLSCELFSWLDEVGLRSGDGWTEHCAVGRRYLL
jgi:hypothetical protein